jgi:hypothetical protein
MSAHTESEKYTTQELDDCIHRAMSRVNVRTENDLCRYIPGRKGQLHHFAYHKLKRTQPIELQKMIKEYILENESPKEFSKNPKTSFGVKSTVDLKLKRSQINRLVDILKKSGDEELISMLAPHQTLRQVQKSMQDMVRSKAVDLDLWAMYVKLVEEEKIASK